MIWRYISGILRILVACTIITCIVIGIKEELNPHRLLLTFVRSPRSIIPYVLLDQFLGCYAVYMIINAVRQFKGLKISFKILYIVCTAIVLFLNSMMFYYFITSDDKVHIIKTEGAADSLALFALFFAVIDFFPFFINKKKKEVKKRKSRRFSTDDYQDIISDQEITQPTPISP